MKQCQKCGTFNEDNSSLCISCNTSLNDSFTDTDLSNPIGLNDQHAIEINNSNAVASMVLGILSIPFLLANPIGVGMGIVAVILGFKSRTKIRLYGGTEKDQRIALAGIITGFISIGLTIIGVIILIYAFYIFITTPFSW